MGPRPWRRGEGPGPGTAGQPAPGFNGAAPLEARRAGVVVGDRVRVRASMGPRPWRRGEPAGQPVYPVRQGASMGPRPWRRGEKEAQPQRNRATVASMGPRPWRRGEPPARARHRIGIARFNGAAPLEARREAAKDEASRLAKMLQWGRAPGGAESRRARNFEVA